MELMDRLLRLKMVLLILNLFLLSSFLTSAFSKESLLIIREEGENFNAAVKGMTDEINEDFTIHEMIAQENLCVDHIDSKIKSVAPKMIVLMDNKIIDLYKQYQSQLKPTDPVVPSISLMGVFIGMLLDGMKNVAGLFYEVPIVTSVINIRAVFKSPFTTIAVIHRNFMSTFIEENKKYCANEKIELINFSIPDSDDIESNLKKHLKLISKNQKIDAIWVPNDSLLINAQLLKSVWLPFRKYFEKPIIVGVEVLVNPQFNFGTFAVVPDHIELGAQAGRLILDIMDNDWHADRTGIVLPFSVKKILNYKQSKHLFELKDNFRYKVDKILE
ncbi:MAG: hypothetical protein HQK77_15640 [Desulfobacterales bacterium]|nr:hypothetical protein [Desulfobacterales bacterium]